MAAVPRYDDAMTWLLPTPLLVLSGALALVVVWTRPQRSLPLGRLMVETFAITTAIIAGWAIFWAALWAIEQRW